MNGTDFASYGDDNTPYTIRNDMENVIFKCYIQACCFG